MPLIAWAYLAYVAGLLAGFSSDRRIAAAVGVVSATLLLACVVRGRLTAAALHLILLTGLLVATVSPPRPARNHGAEPPSGALARVRASAGARIDRVFADNAPMVRALLIADQQEIGVEMRDRYASAGLVHMLSISGLHVAIVAGALQLLLTAASLPRARATGCALLIVWLYVAVIGAPAPALRSAMMLSVGAISLIVQRPTSPWASLAVGAFLPLYQSATVLSLGYQLSVAGMAGLAASARLSKRWLADRLEGWRLGLSSQLLSSVVATLVSAPLIAWAFGRMSLVGPLANLVVSPVIAVLQPMLFLGLVLSPVAPLGEFVADAASPLLRAFDGTARLAASLPYASIHVTPSLFTAAMCAGAVACFVVGASARFSRRPVLLGAAFLSVAVWRPLLPQAGGYVELHVLDVGQGDAIALRTDRGNWVVFDAGRSWERGNAARAVIIPHLARRGGRLRAFVLSHPHNDHAGGAAELIAAMRPGQFWDPGFVAPTGSYAEALAAARRTGTEWERVNPGDSVRVDGAMIRFLGPDSAWASGLTDPNEASAIARVEFGVVRFLLVGDAEKGEEAWLLANHADALRADVLKVAHHGSSTSTTEGFLEAVSPRAAVISVGARNSYGHPSRAVVDRLRRSGAMVLRTDSAGTVVIRTDGRRISVKARGLEWELQPERRAY